MNELREFREKAQVDTELDERFQKSADAIEAFVEKGIIDPPNYQRYVNLLYQMKKILFV